MPPNIHLKIYEQILFLAERKKKRSGNKTIRDFPGAHSGKESGC